MRYSDKAWMHYIKDIIAADVPSAVFLASYIKSKRLNNNITSSFEVIDISNSKIVKSTSKVQKIMLKKSQLPFIFIVGKN